ncbi:Apo Saccharopine reductase [Trichoderma cornu-damae]|uniref:Apo Saccharopine reductase n=1 Tax=Trichoderma cornu-damae TaxID=654480 RepID=A0A9P8QSQ8_9HYPO|nr:Apo Saccharopine reductase [Trichoderma cornu-damae]
MASQRVLLLGSGFVAKPTLDILAESGIEVTVACRNIGHAVKLSEGVKLAKPISLDVTNDQALDAAVAQHDLIISLIPYTFHAAVIKSAIRHKKHVVTTSYISPSMLELDQQAKDAGITVMNEIGASLCASLFSFEKHLTVSQLDPGIDHLYAVSVIERVHQAGGKIKSFVSYCGGLTAPEDDSLTFYAVRPRGVLLALRNAASFYEGGEVVKVAGPDLMSAAKPYHIYPGFALVAYPNRDSTPYKERYNIPEAETIIRGTLRYQGFPEFVNVLVDIGLLSDEEQSFLREPIPWREATQKILGAASASEADLLEAISAKPSVRGRDDKERLLSGLRWLGILSDSAITPNGNPLDTLCALLEEKMSFEQGERDFVLLQHRFEIENKDGTREVMTSTLTEYGAPYGSSGPSAMSRLVGIPCAVGKCIRPTVFSLMALTQCTTAAKLVLDGTIGDRGIIAPLSGNINGPLMRELREKYGIECREKVVL